MNMFITAILLATLMNMCMAQLSPYDDCPRGTYRENPLSRECKLCSKGYFGDVRGLTTNTCSAPCPMGRYGDNFGAKTEDDCKLCPPGKIGSSVGLTTSECSRSCPKGRYSSSYGATTIKDCQTCPPGYFGWQCYTSEVTNDIQL
mmetsp:Transcript_49471/g.97843  ORF Transcript_49471/g.97843 Transcript_49471/m.97843 type:complete len:145 (-) Transcript_49471:56-490(-)